MNHSTEIALEKHQDAVGAKVGMWIFLFTELLLFGGPFLLYAVYLNQYPQDFHFGSSELDKFLGALNTVILLTSSMTMALSIAALQRKNQKLTIILLVVTMLLGTIFMVNKYFEWGAKISHGIYPNSPTLLEHSHGEILFYSLYFVMTGLHGLHVLVGVVIMAFMLYFITKKSHKVLSLPPNILERFKGKRLMLADEGGTKLWESHKINDEITEVGVLVRGPSPEHEQKSNIIQLENVGLYWHLVDIIWIFLFPLFYLIAM